jgi:phosphoribosylformylglycinamidine synthase subunit PurL
MPMSDVRTRVRTTRGGNPRHAELGLTDSEYDRIVALMGREPNEVELAMFSLMWSEHCGYKHSRKLLKTLPTEGPRVVMGPGENAGAVDVGGGLSCAFKVESHNHPSAVEPFQGAATGVGGILRDVFAVGARPIAVLDSLRFGEPAESQRSRYLLERAVAGIGHYGNSIGVATVGGEIYFESVYEQNCLVNAMCLGLIETEKLIRSAAAGVGNVVVLFGARTGRDGIGGASVLASAELGDEDASKRPTVQIGDPFEEAKLLECSLELLDRGLLVALQDLGAAGLTSSSAEMAAKGEVGLDLDVSKVPLREAGMEPFEIMISESQERMLCVVEPERVQAVLDVCAKWEVNATAIGVVTDSGRLRVLVGDTVAGDLPVPALVDECPVYDLEPAPPTTSVYPAPARVLAEGAGPGETLLALLGSANIASRRPVFEQYDCIVGSRTARRPEQADAAVLMLDANGDGARRPALAVSIDGNGRRVACDPYRGAVEAVLECSANLACVGAEPLGLTNCLNFGNPEKPHIAWQLSRAVAGLGDACRALGVPVVGGNVSLYNEGGGGPIHPTPVVGMVGELPDAERAVRLGFAQPGDAVGLIAASGWAPSLTGSELAKLRGEAPEGDLPAADLGELRAVHAAIRQAVRSGALRSAHDVAEGGLAVALAECCIAGGLGAEVTVDMGEAALFGEGPGAFLVSGPREAFAAFGAAAAIVGTVGGDELSIAGALSVPLGELSGVHAGGLADLMG